LIGAYEALLEELANSLTQDKHAMAVELASIPERIRGFGHVKERHILAAKAEEAALLGRYRAGSPPLKLAAE